MISSHFRTTFRSLARHKAQAILHLAGLSVGLTAFILISAYVHFENSYDRMLAGGDVYRVESQFYRGSQMTDNWATSTNGYAPALKDNFPGVGSYTRISWHDDERVVRNGDITLVAVHRADWAAGTHHFCDDGLPGVARGEGQPGSCHQRRMRAS
jgi:putative ABC transport system permease protein